MNSFISSYVTDYCQLIESTNAIRSSLISIKDALEAIHQSGKKTIIIGNGGSAAIASHVSVDLTKNAGIRCINFNEADLLTCFANDFGYEQAYANAIDYYGDEGDGLIAISSSGTSKNIINACQSAKDKKFSKVITLSGFEEDNPLSQCGNLNLWADSKSYNMVENCHQFWLLLVVDMVIGKAVYSA